MLWDTITKKPKKIFNFQQTGIYQVIFWYKKKLFIYLWVWAWYICLWSWLQHQSCI
jgi:hypothetical protein